MYVHTLQDHVYIMCVTNGIVWYRLSIWNNSNVICYPCLYVSQSCLIVECNVYIWCIICSLNCRKSNNNNYNVCHCVSVDTKQTHESRYDETDVERMQTAGDGGYITFPLLCNISYLNVRRRRAYMYIIYNICIISNISILNGVFAIWGDHTKQFYYYVFYFLRSHNTPYTINSRSD